MAQQFPVADGFTQLANGLFIPEIFSLKLLARYYEEALVPKICNTDYEGEIKKVGDTVHCRRVPEAQVRRYFAGQSLLRQTVVDEEVALLINNGAYWNIPVDELQKRQADVNWVSQLEQNAATQQRRYVDQQVLGTIYTAPLAANLLTDQTLTANLLPQTVADMKQALRQNFVPEQNCWLVVPYWEQTLFVLNDTFISAEKMGDAKSMIRDGAVGVMLGMTVYGSPNLAIVAGLYQTLYGCITAVTFASQFIMTETLKNPDAFGDLIRGLQVFGFITVQPGHIGKRGAIQG